MIILKKNNILYTQTQYSLTCYFDCRSNVLSYVFLKKNQLNSHKLETKYNFAQLLTYITNKKHQTNHMMDLAAHFAPSHILLCINTDYIHST